MSHPGRRGHNTDRQSPLRVAVDARLKSGLSGGVESVVIGLASGLSRLRDGNEEYLFLASEGDEDWVQPYVAGPARLLMVPGLGQRRGVRIRMRSGLRRTLPGVASAWRRRFPPASDGSIERARVDVMHFSFQQGFRTSIPSIYHPHDLQHLHLPEYFTKEQRVSREHWYRTLCKQASLVAVASTWTKNDVERHYHLPVGKVRVVPLAPPTAEYGDPTEAEVAEAAARLCLPGSYVLYPAQTWPHKNHIGLVDALAKLRRQNALLIPLVASGHQNEFHREIVQHTRELGIEDQVHWLGFLSPRDLKAVYRLARAVVIPSKFEAASGPLWEAFLAGVPAACSNVTSLPDQAGDAALLFDPDQPEQIAAAIQRVWLDDGLRASLVSSGRQRVRLFTWDKTARLFRAHYRRLASRPLTDEDVDLLAAEPLL